MNPSEAATSVAGIRPNCAETVSKRCCAVRSCCCKIGRLGSPVGALVILLCRSWICCGRAAFSDVQLIRSVFEAVLLFGNSGFIVGEKARNRVPFLPVLILSERSSPSRVRFPAPKKRRALDCCGPL